MASAGVIRCEQCLVFEHGAGDSEEPVGDGSQSAGMAVAARSERGILGLAEGVTLYGAVGPLVDGVLEPVVGREVARGAPHWLVPGSTVVTDGPGCWRVLGEGAYSRRPVLAGSGPKPARAPSFKWVNTTLGNTKSPIAGTYRKLGPDHAERYLASFAWRYNRRYHLKTMIPRFVHSAARTNPLPYRSLIAG